MTLEAGRSVDQELPTSYNGFAFAIRGSARIGENAAELDAGQVGWLDRPAGEGASVVRVVAGAEGARVVLYAGQPQGDPIVSHGPFIGDSKADIARLYAEYRAGRFERMSNLARRSGIA
jgi:redox-sensitive bicupin YhaK (pirin superfamily)